MDFIQDCSHGYFREVVGLILEAVLPATDTSLNRGESYGNGDFEGKFQNRKCHFIRSTFSLVRGFWVALEGKVKVLSPSDLQLHKVDGVYKKF